MSKDLNLQITWNKKASEDIPAGTFARLGDISLQIKRSKTKIPKWRLYLGIWSRKDFGVRDGMHREMLVAEYPGELTVKEVRQEADKYLRNFVGTIMMDWEKRG